MRVLQLKFQHSITTSALIEQILIQENIAIVIIRKQHVRNIDYVWIADNTGTATICLSNNSAKKMLKRLLKFATLWYKYEILHLQTVILHEAILYRRLKIQKQSL